MPNTSPASSQHWAFPAWFVNLPIRTLVDTALQDYQVVWAAAGHVHTVFPTTFSELLRITSGTPADVS